MNRMKLACGLLPLLLTATWMGGCSGDAGKGSAENNATASAQVEAIQEPDAVNVGQNEAPGLPTDDWVGRWTGLEGLFLDIQPSPDGKQGHYAIANRDNLDRQGDYSGVADGTTIRFVRDGRDLTIRPGIGDETGFKYLAGRKDCLILIPGQEGYCR